MFDKVQESLKKSKDERQKKRLEKERVRLEKAAAEAVREKERLQQEAEKIQAEKERLLSLDDKGLMVELILAVLGLWGGILCCGRGGGAVRCGGRACACQRSSSSLTEPFPEWEIP